MVFFALSSARAQGQTDLEAKANSLVEEGNALGAAGKLEEAIKKFKAAEEILPRALHDCNIGLASVHLQEWIAAHYHLTRCRKRWTSADGEQPSWLESNLEGVETQLSAGTFARLEIASEPVGAAISVDGNRLVETSMWVVKGAHQLEATKPGFKKARMTVTLTSGERRTIVVPLAEVTPPPKAKPAPAKEPKPEGSIAALTTEAPPRRDKRSWLIAGVATTTVGVGAAALAFLFRGRASDARDDLFELNTAATTHFDAVGVAPLGYDADYAAASDSLDENNLRMALSFAVSGALVTTGALFLYRGLSSGTTELSVTASPTEAGAAARWHF